MNISYKFKSAVRDTVKPALHVSEEVAVLPPLLLDGAQAAPPPPLSRHSGSSNQADNSKRLQPDGDIVDRNSATPNQPADAAPTGQSFLPVKWQGKLGRLVLVTRSRGGMGATSVAVNLALELVRPRRFFRSGERRHVALVDLDIQFGTAGSILDIEDRGSLLELARMAEEPDLQAVRTALVRHESGLHVLPAPSKAIPLNALDEIRVASIIDQLLRVHDFVVVDLPHALVQWLEPLLMRADRLLMVTDLAVPSVVTARQVIDVMREDNPDLKVEIVVTRERQLPFQSNTQRDASEALGLPLRHWFPDETKLSRKALDRGEPLVELSPRCPWSRALRKLAQHIKTAVAAADQNQKG